ncbi:MAG: tRNA glutamyl-Q(34) synthetase GluQRS [Clostridia bacterium]|nr:tRNA glutamyl-Q(34) synthetase GluQRS [Clostridia bacterium]
MERQVTGRFAPTPSGRLHLGNIFTAMIGYLSVKSRGGKYLLRIEDLDAARCPKSLAYAIMRDLDYFGFEFDGEIIWQSERADVYKNYFDILDREGLIYPCFCSRAQLHASTAPHGDTPVYDGKCRLLSPAERPKRKGAARVIVPDETVSFTDGLYGYCEQDLKKECGDFIVRRADGVFAYQLAVVVDDGESGVTEVVRGRDLLPSSPRQLFLFDKFGFQRPDFTHVPLMMDANGERMSKREGKSNLEYITANFPDPRPVIGMLAFNCGLTDKFEPLSLKELIPLYDVKKLKKEDIILDDRGLFSK